MERSPQPQVIDQKPPILVLLGPLEPLEERE